MKKLMLWLSIVLAIGLTAQTAKAATYRLGYNVSAGNGWEMAAFSTSENAWSYDLGKVAGNDAFFFVSTESGADWPGQIFTNNTGGNGTVTTTPVEMSYQNRNGHVLVIPGVKDCKVRVHFEATSSGAKIWYSVYGENMPLKPADFANGKSHYFLVGTRMADWRLQPEWELKDLGNGKVGIETPRVMYTGLIGVAKVSSYTDYVLGRYTRYNYGEWGVAENSAEYNLYDKGAFDFYSSATPNHTQADKFAADQDLSRFSYNNVGDQGTSDTYKAILESKGVVIDRIEVSLNNGNPSRIKFTYANNPKDVSKFITFSLVGSEIKNVNLEDAKATQGNADAWSDAWIQYDENGQPYRDAKGTLIYQTVFQNDWLETHPSYFSKNLRDERLFDYSSRNIVMENVRNMSAKELADDPYAALYARFDGDNNKTFAAGRVNVGDFSYDETVYYHNADGSTTEGTRGIDTNGGNNWECFVVKDMWISDAFKIWTGWGGGRKVNEYSGPSDADKNNPRWYYVNGGHFQADNDYSITGSDLSQSNKKVNLYATKRDVAGANFKVDNLTYFKRVIVWYDPSSKDFDNSLIQLIIENCGPNIKAFRGDNATISYPWLVPGDDLSPEEKQFSVKKYQITRYRLNDNGEWVVDQRKPEVITDGKHINDYIPETDGTDENLPSGTYRYEIDFTYVNGSGETITRNAVSNEVTLYDASAPVQAVSYQRVVEAGEKDLDGTTAAEKLYSFDAVLDLNISSTALSQSYDGVYTRDLIDGYLIKIGETEMTDLNVTKLYVNGKEYAKTFYTDNSKTVYVGGTTETLSGYWMEVPFADFGGEVKLSLRWENCAKQEPGPAYNYEVFLIPDADKISQFAAAQFGSTTTRFEMHIPGITFNWDNSGIAQREFDGTHDDNCLPAMPMGTHLDATNLYAPIHYSEVNYLYANGKLGTAPVTESVRRGFDIVVKAGTAADNLAEAAEDAAYNVKDIAIDQYANEDASFPCERNLMKLQGAPAVLVHGWSAIDYVRKELVASETEKRHMGRSEAKLGGIATIVLDPLAAPDFSTDKPQVTGTFMDTDAKVRYSVHNLYLLFSINNGVSAQTNGTELFRTVGFYVAPETQTVPAAFIPANDKSARGGIVAHESNKGEFNLNAALAGYTPFEATSGFSQDNNWSEMAYNQEHLPVIVNYYAAKQGNTEMTGAELPMAKATLTYHYPFMSGDHVLTLTEGTTKNVSLSDAAISTGIEGVSADLDGEVTYYNMQGIRVENPVEGQVYLEVSAEGVRKVMK